MLNSGYLRSPFKALQCYLLNFIYLAENNSHWGRDCSQSCSFLALVHWLVAVTSMSWRIASSDPVEKLLILKNHVCVFTSFLFCPLILLIILRVVITEKSWRIIFILSFNWNISCISGSHFYGCLCTVNLSYVSLLSEIGLSLSTWKYKDTVRVLRDF